MTPCAYFKNESWCWVTKFKIRKKKKKANQSKPKADESQQIAVGGIDEVQRFKFSQGSQSIKVPTDTKKKKEKKRKKKGFACTREEESTCAEMDWDARREVIVLDVPACAVKHQSLTTYRPVGHVSTRSKEPRAPPTQLRTKACCQAKLSARHLYM